MFARKKTSPGETKYHSRKVILDGITLDSQFEARVYVILRDDPRVKILQVHPRYILQEKYRTKDGRNIRCIEYVSDFIIDIGGEMYIVDAKGMETTDFKIKRKIFEKRYPDESLKIVHSLKALKELLQ